MKPTLATYQSYAAAAAQVLTSNWYTAGNSDWWTSGSGFWHSANALETLIDYMTLSGDKQYQDVIDPACQAFGFYFNPSFGSPGYYDDEGWWGIAILKAFTFTQNQSYLTTATQIFDDLANGWDSTAGGGIWQERNPKSYPDNFKGSIANELFLVLAARLYNTPALNKDQKYLDWANKTWAWLQASGMINKQSLVFGQISEQGCVDVNNYPQTYTQGVLPGGLVELYKATGDSALLIQASAVANAAILNMVWPGGVLQDAAERMGIEPNNDVKQFKGVYMRYLGQLYTGLKAAGVQPVNVTLFQDFIKRNADSVWAAYPHPQNAFGMDWQGTYSNFVPDSEPYVAGTLQTSALDALNAAMLLPVNHITPLVTTYLDKAVTAGQILTSKWFDSNAPLNWVPNDYWRTPTICTVLVELMSETGQPTYLSTIENARTQGEGWLTTCGYYDDLTVWGRFFMMAYNYLQTASPSKAAAYLADAQIVAQQLKAAWDASSNICGGGVWWQREPTSYPGNFKASNATLGYSETCINLYLAMGKTQQNYLDQAVSSMKWLIATKVFDAPIPGTSAGMVWGGLNQSCGVDVGNGPVVGLQGNPLGPLWSLYEATGDTSYLDLAQQVVDATMKNLVWSGTQILETSIDAEWDGQGPQWQSDNSGPTLFKGIFTRYLGVFTKNLATLKDPVRQKASQQYAAFLKTNADAVWSNYPGQIFGMDWHSMHGDYQVNPDDQVNACLQYSGLAALLAAALVS